MILKHIPIWLCFLSHTIISSFTHNFIQVGNVDKSPPHSRRLHNFLRANNVNDQDGTMPLLDQLDNTPESPRARELIVLDSSESDSDLGPSTKSFNGPNAQKKRVREHETAFPSSKAARVASKSSKLVTVSINPDKASNLALEQSYKALQTISKFIPTMASRAQDQIKTHRDLFNDMSGMWTEINSMIKPILRHRLPGADPQAHESLTSWKFKNIVYPLFIDGIIWVQMELDKGKGYILQRDLAEVANLVFKHELIWALGRDDMIRVCEFTSPYDKLLVVAWRLVEKWMSRYQPDWRNELDITKVGDLLKNRIQALINEDKKIISVHEYQQNFDWPRSTYTLRKEYIMKYRSPNVNVNSHMQKSVRPQNRQDARSPEEFHYLPAQLKTQKSSLSATLDLLSQQRQTPPLVDYELSLQPATLHNTKPQQTTPTNQKLTPNDWDSFSEKGLNHLVLASGPMRNHEVLDGMIDGHDQIIHSSPSTPIASSNSGPSEPEDPKSPLLSGVSMLSDQLSSEEQDAVVGLTALGHTFLEENGPTYRAEHVEGALHDIKRLVLDHFDTYPVKNIYQAAHRDMFRGDYNNVIRCLRAARILSSPKQGVMKEVSRDPRPKASISYINNQAVSKGKEKIQE